MNSTLEKKRDEIDWEETVCDDECPFDNTEACDQCTVRPCPNDYSYD